MISYSLLLMGIFTLPTHLAQLIPHFKRKYPPPFILYISSLITNIGIALFVSIFECFTLDEYKDSFNNGDFIVYLIFGCILTPIGLLLSYSPCFYCCFTSISPFEDPYKVDDELKAGLDDEDCFCNKLAKNRSFPPVIQVCSQAWHYEYRTNTYRDASGNTVNETYSEKVVTYSNSAELKYSSWQENGNPIKLTTNSTVIHSNVECIIMFDDESLGLINQLQMTLRDDARPHDAYVDIFNNFYIPGMESSLCGTTRNKGQKMPCATKCVPTCCGRCMIGFLKLFGYSTILYSAWCSHGEHLNMKLVKQISMKPKTISGLRCSYGEFDTTAVETTFHSINPNEQIEQPIFNEEEFQEFYTSMYKPSPNFVPNSNDGSGLSIEPGMNEMQPNQNDPEMMQNNHVSRSTNGFQDDDRAETSDRQSYKEEAIQKIIGPFVENNQNNETQGVQKADDHFSDASVSSDGIDNI